jgi:hypothetical protein
MALKFLWDSSMARPLPLITLLLWFPFSIALHGQTTTSGALAGIVTDSSHAVIPEANVEIRDLTKGVTQKSKTDRNGTYAFSFLTPARYRLLVWHSGFQQEERIVNVLLGPPISVNITLGVAKAETTLNVSGEAPPIQGENGDVSSTMNQKQVSELPNPGNDLTYIAQTAPGVVMNTDIQGGANFSILGMPGFSYLHTIDGMDDNDNSVNLSQVGALILLLGQNQVQEATVVSTGYSGQFGGAAGGNVNYVTKSGDNQFHGNAQYYWNGRILNANNWFLKSLGGVRPFSIANQWAGSLGGPIRKDKVFFFLDSEGLRLVIPQQFLVIVPSLEFETATIEHIDSDARFGANSATDRFYRQMFDLYNATPGVQEAQSGVSPDDPIGCGEFSDPNSSLGIDYPCSRFFFTTRSAPSQDALTSGRVDWNISRTDRAFLRLQYDSGHGAIGSDPISPLFDADFTQPWWQGQILDTHTFGSSAANQLVLAGSYFSPVFQLKTPSQALAAFPTTLDFVQGPFTGLGGAANVLALGFGRHNAQYQLSDDFAKVLGGHKLGLGMNIERINWNELPARSGTIGHLDVQTLRAFFEGGVASDSPLEDFTFLTQSFTSQKKLPISFFNLALYGNEQWHARPNLDVTVALRAEHYSNPVCHTRCFARLAQPFESLDHDPTQQYDEAILIGQRRAFVNTDRILWSPRLSFAWQLFGVHRNTVLRGGIGVFYDPIPGRILDSFSGNPPLLNSYILSDNNLTPDENSSLFKDAEAFNDAFDISKTLAQIQSLVPNFVPPAISSPASHTHSPQYQRWSLELQQGWGPNTSFNVGYFGYHGIHGLMLNPSVNAFGFGSFPATFCSSPPVPPCADLRFREVTEIDTNAASHYSGFVASFRHRFSRWSSGIFQANYTYGHALDEVSTSGQFIFSAASIPTAQDPKNLRGNYGSADQDVRHSLNANYVWDIPLKAVLGSHRVDRLVEGWQLSGTLFARTGFPYTVFDFEESGTLAMNNNYFSLLYAVPARPLGSDPQCGKSAAVTLNVHPCQPPQVLEDGFTPNPQARFLQSGCATAFNAGRLPGSAGPCDGPAVSFSQGRNRFRGPGYFSTDMTVMKNTVLPGWEKATLGIGLQLFNLFNHPNFGFPDAGLSSSTFGQIEGLEQPPTSILGSGFGGDASPRMIQVKIQLQF